MRSTCLGGWTWLVWPLLVVVALAGCSRKGDRDDTSSHNSASASPSDNADEGPGIEVAPEFDLDDGDADSGSENQDNDAGGGEEPEPPQTTEQPEPTDSTEEVFRAVVPGTCLPVYRDGSDWNVSVPPDPVSCRSDRAGLFEVTYVDTGSTTCPTGVGLDGWSYYSTVTGDTTTLCLDRVWVRYYCVLAESSGDGIASIGHTTAVDCGATNVPVPYDAILVVAAVYRAPPGANASNCRTHAQDASRYWSLLAHSGKTLVCFTERS